MRLGEFRKETEHLPDDYILDDVMYILYMPGYYDGYPNECKNGKAIYTNEPKIRFYMYDTETRFYDVCEANKTYEENLKMFLSAYERGMNISDSRWDNYINHMKVKFDVLWNGEEWKEFLRNENS